MSKSYKVFPRTLTLGEKKGQTVYSVHPVLNLRRRMPTW